MAVLAELLIAPVEEAQAVAREAVPSQRWPGVDVKGHSSVSLGALLAILRDEEWSPEIFDSELLAQGGDNGPFVTSVPADFVTAVAAIPDEQLEPLAHDWSLYDEADRWTIPALRELVAQIRGLCRRAGGASMLLWMSL